MHLCFIRQRGHRVASFPFRVPASKPSVRLLSKEQVISAIDGGSDDNLILQELTNLINAYLEECNRLGGGGLIALHQKTATCPIEEIALNMAIAAEQAKINKIAKELKS